MSISRVIRLPSRSFFLFGPRGTGKSTWLEESLKKIPIFNLLKTSTFLELSKNPGLLEAKIGNLPVGSWVCIDEVQKVPQILDEVHRLIELKKWRFALSGSSARKLKKESANLLGGRALTLHMEPFSYIELGKLFRLKEILEWGCLPLIVLNRQDAREILRSYIFTYIKEEIKQEGLVRKVEPFLRFLEIAGILNGQQVNAENIARDAHIPRSNVDVYFSILEDTLLGHWLPAYRPQAKVREVAHPKFYWFDFGVARGAAGFLDDPLDELMLGVSLETYFFHELRVYNLGYKKNRSLFFYKNNNNQEIDFVIETKKRTMTTQSEVVLIEVKSSKKWDRKWENSMRSLAETQKVKVRKMIGVYQGTESYFFDEVEVYPVEIFLKKLYAGDVY